MRRVVEGLVVYPERMQENMDSMRGLIYSQPVMLALTAKGLTRQRGYELVQKSAMRVWDEGLDLKTALLDNESLLEHLTRDEVEACCTLDRHLVNVDAIIDRALRAS